MLKSTKIFLTQIFMCLYLKAHPVFCKAVLTDLNQYCLSVCVPSYDFRSVKFMIILGDIV